MNTFLILCLSVLGCNGVCRDLRPFPDDFLLGAATSSHQIEGAWNEDGKGENIWDHMSHTNPAFIKDGSNADIAADSYHNYKRDVEMMRELGLDVYRFSLSWARILPTGFTNNINEAGVAFYNNYINEMVKYNIQPMVTLYHWDMPQRLQTFGGFMNPLFSVWYEDYARLAFELFGDRVKLWITFNEPKEICYRGYGADQLAPALNATGIGEYVCAKHLVLAHAKAYHAYNNDYRSIQGGQCGFTCSITWAGPLTESDEDKHAAELLKQADWVMYTYPIYSAEGGFPKELETLVAEKSAMQGYPRSRMPEFTEEQKDFVRGTYDFIGVNHYTAVLVSATQYKVQRSVPSILDDIDIGTYTPDDWPKSSYSWLKMAPHSLLNVLLDLDERYNHPDIYVTENGWSQLLGDGLIDDGRITYIRAALEDALDALDAGVSLKGYMTWSLMDNFEWSQGYLQRFGLYQVDFEDPMRTRTPRKSAFVYKQIIKTRVVDHEYTPPTMTMTIDERHCD